MSEKYVSFEYKKNPVSIGVVSRNGWKQVVDTVVKIESIEIVYIPIDQNTVAVTDTVTGPIHKTIKIPYGFDTRNILAKYGDYVELKRDGLLCVHWAKK